MPKERHEPRDIPIGNDLRSNDLLRHILHHVVVHVNKFNVLEYSDGEGWVAIFDGNIISCCKYLIDIKSCNPNTSYCIVKFIDGDLL